MSMSNPHLVPPALPPPTRPSRFAARLDAFQGLAFNEGVATDLKGQWRAHFARRMGPAFNGRLAFEIGCFDAEFLCRIAQQHPNTGFIGLDWKAGALCQGAERAAVAKLHNVALVHGRAQNAHKLFAVQELDDIWIFHPDPCDKPKELPNRLITGPFLLELHTLLRSRESCVAIKTDHPGYFQWLLALLGLRQPPWFAMLDPGAVKTSPKTRRRDLVHPSLLPARSAELLEAFHVSASSSNLWEDPATLSHIAGQPFAGQTTLFESRFLKKRLPIYYVELRKSLQRVPPGSEAADETVCP
jgi:tRNA G46 methylase TrmB